LQRGWTPLHFCAQKGSVEVAQLLLAAAGDAASSARDAQGKTPYDVACGTGHLAMRSLLRPTAGDAAAAMERRRREAAAAAANAATGGSGAASDLPSVTMTVSPRSGGGSVFGGAGNGSGSGGGSGGGSPTVSSPTSPEAGAGMARLAREVERLRGALEES
jgi:hypothetical protein